MPILITLLSWHVKFSKDLTKSRLGVSNLPFILHVDKNAAKSRHHRMFPA